MSRLRSARSIAALCSGLVAGSLGVCAAAAHDGADPGRWDRTARPPLVLLGELARSDCRVPAAGPGAPEPGRGTLP